MKNLLVLGGLSERNRDWVDTCVSTYGDLFDQVFFTYYDHWETDASEIDFDREIQKVEDILAAAPDGEWYICAKSIGTILSFKLVQQGVIAPKKCIFFGMPFSVIGESVFQNDFSVLETYSVPTLAVHIVDDPVALLSTVHEVVTNHLPTVTVTEIPGDTHAYRDFPDYKDMIADFIS